MAFDTDKKETTPAHGRYSRGELRGISETGGRNNNQSFNYWLEWVYEEGNDTIYVGIRKYIPAGYNDIKAPNPNIYIYK